MWKFITAIKYTFKENISEMFYCVLFYKLNIDVVGEGNTRHLRNQ